MIVDIDTVLLNDVIEAITSKRNEIYMENYIEKTWKNVPSFSGFTGATNSQMEKEPVPDEIIDLKLKKFENLINQLKAQTDFT